MYQQPVFQLCWLRESSSGHLDFDAGTKVAANHLELAILGLAPGGAGETTAASAMPTIHKLEVHHIFGALQSYERVQSLPKWLNWRLTAFFGPLNNEFRIEAARHNLQTVCSLCDRVREANAGHAKSEVYLPYLSRREWNLRFESFERMRFERRNGGIQLVQGSEPRSLESIVMRTAALVFQPRPDADLPFRFAASHCNLEQPWAGMLAERWGVSLRSGAPIRSLEMSLSGQSVDAWRKSPRLHHGRYHQIWSRVSLSLQWVLRRWSLAMQMSSVKGLEDIEGSFHLMMFNSLRPWAENSRADLCYDVLNENHMIESFRRASRRLQIHMETAAIWLEKHGQTDLAFEYRSADPSLLAARVAERCFRGRAVRAMLIAETGLVNALTRFSQEVKMAETPRAIRKTTDKLVKAFDDHLPRIFREPGASRKVASGIFLEVTSTMALAVGGSPRLDVQMETVTGELYRCDYHALTESLSAI